jgi:DNA adenine methylase
MNSIQIIQDTFDINAIYAQKVHNLVKGDNYIEEIRKIISEKPKPFVKWVGGKRQLLSQFRLLNLYPPNGFNPNKSAYFEPFVGGGAVFFDLLPEKAFLSDLNNDLVVTYNVIKSDVDELIDSLKKHIYEKDYFLKIRKLDPKILSNIEVASRFVYLNRTCFNGMYRVNKSGQFNVPFGRYSNPQICDELNLRRVSKALKNIEINCQDYKGVLKNAKRDDFIYFDPPYYPINSTSSFTSYTPNAFLDKEQVELRNTFAELNDRGCYVMLSNSDTPFINNIYSELKNKGVKITKIVAGRAINSKGSGRGKITEVLVTNY